MGCKKKAYCDFCDARCGAFVVEKEEWLQLCQKYNKWCPLEEVEGLSYLEVEKYIKNLPTFSPQ